MTIIMCLKISRIIILILMLIPCFAWSQQCHEYKCVISKVEKLMKKTQKDYKAILDNLDSAEGYPDSKAEQIRTLRRKVFIMIENEKNEAKRAKDEAKKQTELAKNALVQLEIEKQTAIAEKTKAQVAEVKAKAVIDKIYFYEDKFGLAYDKNSDKYGFIDKDLKTKIDFSYDEALPFDYTGFAKVKGNDTYYMIDTLGKEFFLATETNQIDSNILAIDLSGKKLQNIPINIFNNSQLLILNIANNKLETLPKEINGLKNLTHLYINGNQLISIPNELWDLINLRNLDFHNSYKVKNNEILASQNKIQTISPKIGQLRKLQKLNFSSVDIAQIPNELLGLTNLTYLDLGGNQLTMLSDAVGNLENLKHLDLSSNQLIHLPTQLGMLINLTFLDLSDNQLEELPYSIDNLSSLTYLDLSDNQLDLTDDIIEIVRKMRNLTYLDVSGNDLPFEDYKELRKLLPKCEIICDSISKNSRN
jgi:hypothetical protein